MAFRFASLTLRVTSFLPRDETSSTHMATDAVCEDHGDGSGCIESVGLSLAGLRSHRIAQRSLRHSVQMLIRCNVV